MSAAGLASVTRSVEEVKAVVAGLTEDEAARPSGCQGWTVKDLVAHLSSNFKETVEPSPPPAEPVVLPAERLMDLLVEPRRDWPWAQVRDEYLGYADGALAALAGLQEEPLASTVIPLADLGQYPMHQLADAYAFDHYCHLRIDLLAPTGPIERALAPADDALLGPAVGWMLAGVPQMQPGLERSLAAPLRLELTGPGGGSWRLAVVGGAVAVGEPVGDEVATVTSSAHDFVRWGTARTPWRELCTVTGDAAAAATFLDALNIV
jgi:uncharacterized protein (TIGR03083 family)